MLDPYKSSGCAAPLCSNRESCSSSNYETDMAPPTDPDIGGSARDSYPCACCFPTLEPTTIEPLCKYGSSYAVLPITHIAHSSTSHGVKHAIDGVEVSHGNHVNRW